MSVPVRLSAFVVLTLVCAVAVGCGNTAAPPVEIAEQVAPANPLVGTWSVATITPGDGSGVIDPAQPSVIIFGSDGYYSVVYTRGAEPRAHSAVAWEPTDEEMIAQRDTIIVNTGRYEVAGSTVTLRPIIALLPEFSGGHAIDEFTIDGDVLTVTRTELVSVEGTPSPSGLLGTVMTLRRLP